MTPTYWTVMDFFTVSLIAVTFFSFRLWGTTPTNVQYNARTPLETMGYQPKRKWRKLGMNALVCMVLFVCVGYIAHAFVCVMYGNYDKATTDIKAAMLTFVIASAIRYAQIQDPDHPENH